MDKDFKTLFNETLHNYGVGIAKLSETTGIPERYLEAMRSGNLGSLPPAPYVRGYLNKIGNLAGVNGEELWTAFKKDEQTKTSGSEDRLPENRFSLQKINKGRVVGLAVLVLLFAYGLFRFDVIVGKPLLQISAPVEALFLSNEEIFELSGLAESRDKLTVNGENIIINEDGSFNKKWKLTPGINILEFKVKRFLGLETSETRRVIYTPRDATNATTSLLLP